MSSARDPTIDAALAAVRVQFAEALPEKAANIRSLLARGAWEDARRAAHRLRGSAGTYGFAALGALAAAIEDLLLADPTGPSGEASERVARLAAELHAQAHLAAAERS
jgi:HPt (histidine-containing phosphotransfer) domain-containing protein